MKQAGQEHRRTKRRLTQEERQAMYRASLERAQACSSKMNAAVVIMCFAAKGIEDVLPGENVLTFNAWKALGRHVRKGEHGVSIPVYFQTDSKQDPETGEHEPGKTVKASATVFHISQTDPDEPKPSKRTLAIERLSRMQSRQVTQ